MARAVALLRGPAPPGEVAEDAFAELHAGDYPSLYRTPDGRAHILCGPLALVNHRCAALLSFSLPKKIVVAPVTAAAATSVPATLLRKGGISLEEFAGLSAVYARATMRHVPVSFQPVRSRRGRSEFKLYEG